MTNPELDRYKALVQVEEDFNPYNPSRREAIESEFEALQQQISDKLDSYEILKSGLEEIFNDPFVNLDTHFKIAGLLEKTK